MCTQTVEETVKTAFFACQALPAAVAASNVAAYAPWPMPVWVSKNGSPNCFSFVQTVQRLCSQLKTESQDVLFRCRGRSGVQRGCSIPCKLPVGRFEFEGHV